MRFMRRSCIGLSMRPQLQMSAHSEKKPAVAIQAPLGYLCHRRAALRANLADFRFHPAAARIGRTLITYRFARQSVENAASIPSRPRIEPAINMFAYSVNNPVHARTDDARAKNAARAGRTQPSIC